MTQPTLFPVPAENAPAETVPADAPQISVVVPVYKVEKFVAECLESILSQDFDSFEVVAVDDGSPDASGKICDEFAARDSHLRVFHKENGGVASARKLGVERSRGEWICFVDSDDVLLPHALSALFAATQQFPDADIVEGSHNSFVDNPNVDLPRKIDLDKTATGPIVVPAYDYAKTLATVSNLALFTGSPWRKIIRRSVLLKSRACDLARNVYCEDQIMNIRAASESRKVARIFTRVYAYRGNETSMMHDKTREAKRRTVECNLPRWEAIRETVKNKDERWQNLGLLYIAVQMFFRFLQNPGTFLRDPRVRPYLKELKAARKRLPKPEQRKILLMSVCVVFPFSVLSGIALKIPSKLLKRRQHGAVKKFLKKIGLA